MGEIIFKIGGMSCSGCEKAVEMAISRSIKGVKEAKADHHHQELRILYEELPPTPDEVKQVVEKAGYHFIS